MDTRRRPAVIAYDVRSPLRRQRVHRQLLAWRIDGQKSVHECMLTEREAAELYVQLAELIDPDSDRLLLAWLVPGSEVEGRGLGEAAGLFRRLVRVS